MGFPRHWINLIIRCVSSISYSFLINDKLFGKFIPKKGLRQRDHLSLFLFLLCLNGLSGLYKKAELDISMHGFSLTRACLSISHLLFADDSLLFFFSHPNECHIVLHLLLLYEVTLGQKVNLDKIEVTFGRGVSTSTKVDLVNLIGCKFSNFS